MTSSIYNSPSKSERGVTLIMVAAVLAILAALSTGFYTMMLMQTKSATRFSDSIRAEMMARAGIEYAIGMLHDQAFAKTEDPTDPWYMVDYLHGARRRHSFPADLSKNGIDDDFDKLVDNATEREMGFSMAMASTAEINSDRFTLNVFDSASRINVNACDNLGVLLDNLCRVVGPPLVPANQDFIIPRVWEWYGGLKFNNDANDWPKVGTAGGTYSGVLRDIYYANVNKSNAPEPFLDASDKLIPGAAGRPLLDANGVALFGDGYAIAGYRARKGRFKSLEDIKNALTYVERSSPPNGIPDEPLEQLEIEVKFAAIRDFITINSWVDTSTVCTGKFEWVQQAGGSGSDPYDTAIDRDKSWIPDDPINDPENKRGSLRGSYVAIINGHGAGQLRRIRTNGVDWIKIETFNNNGQITGFVIPPGPTSSYMIIAAEDAKLADISGSDAGYSYNGTAQLPPKLPPNPLPNGVPGYFPKMITSGGVQYLDDDPNIDYATKPLCIHRAPINVNTASDKVLAAMFMGLNISHGHFLSIGTDADLSKLAQTDANGVLKNRYAWNPNDPDWIIGDYNGAIYRTVEDHIITAKGLKRLPGSSGKMLWDVDFATQIKAKLPATYNMDFINNYGMSDPAGTTKINEAQELAYRIIIARQREPDPNNAGVFLNDYIDPKTGAPTAAVKPAYQRGPIRSWDDLYFRVVKPWDDARQNNSIDGSGIMHKASVARMIMAHFNPNTDMLKFNPNIEWIDRWGRNFTALEPVMIYTNDPENNDGGSSGHGDFNGDNYNPFQGKIKVCDMDGKMNNDAIPIFDRERVSWTGGGGLYYGFGPYGTNPLWMGTYITRSYRYKSDEMIDKTDLNRSTTEFSFDSRGIYEIQSSGQVVKRGELLSERKIQSLVKIYDVWTESTQNQFVNGYITRAAGDTGTPTSGTISRDFKNVNDRLALTTLPEPLVPLDYKINNPKNKELVDTTVGSDHKRNAWKQSIDMNVPDVVANKILPAAYDGQIVLATNTLKFDPSETGDADTFLASFNGDLDTDTSNGNGHEQAKTPANCQVRVVDTLGLLGALNDMEIDNDPGLRGDAASTVPVVPDFPPYPANPTPDLAPPRVLRFKVAMDALRGLDPRYYWNNCTCRQGKLRPDGAFIGGPGMAGNDGVLKYACGDDDPAKWNEQNFTLNGKGATRATGEDFNNRGTIGDPQGVLVTMWAKTSWHHDDGREHEFFDCTTPGWNDGGIRAEAFYFRKQGRVQCAVCESGSGTSAGGMSIYEDGTWGVSGAGDRNNDLSLVLEPEQNAGDWSDPDWPIYLFGGNTGVPSNRKDRFLPQTYPPQPNPNYRPESPAYRIQPFRWHYVGARFFLQKEFATSNNAVGGLTDFSGAIKSGFWKPNQYDGDGGWRDQNSIWISQNLFRPFVDSERWPDGQDYQPFAKYWDVCQPQQSTGFDAYQNKGRKGPMAGRGDGGQPVRWAWASPGGKATADGRTIEDNTVFGVSNCNPGQGYSGSGQFGAIYRNSPDEGTYAVLDEYKISRKDTILANSQKTSIAGGAMTALDRSKDRVTRDDTNRPGEMTMSRYYLPPQPESRLQCPTFTSQMMLQSIKGYDKKTSTPPEFVTLARVSWTCFTPRFLHQHKRVGDGNFYRDETITKRTNTLTFVGPGDTPSNHVGFRGPFDYCKYNNIRVENQLGERFEDFDDPSYDNTPAIVPYRCTRATPDQYFATGATDYADKNYQATRGIEVEVLEDADDKPDNNNETILGNGGKPFTNPNILNQILDTGGNPIKVRTDRLRYRVRFRYPVDQLADPGAGLVSGGVHYVDPANHYLLDTPVFDDISITYFTKPRILDYKELLE